MAESFHTLALDGVPIFGLYNRTAAYRLVTLVDVSLLTSLFEARVPDLIYSNMSGNKCRIKTCNALVQVEVSWVVLTNNTFCPNFLLMFYN